MTRSDDEPTSSIVFRPRAVRKTIDEVGSSSDLVTGAPDGENDDLVMAGAYMWHGARNLSRFKRPDRGYRKGSFGEVFKVDTVLKPRQNARRDPYAIER